jgi:flagellar M-ring protein FliF
MNTSISEIIKKFGSAFNKLSKKMKIVIFSFLGAAIIGAIILAVVLNSNKYSLLYRGLSSSESAEILSLLNDMAVDVKVENDGTILVPTDQVAALKMQLASEGYPNSTLDYDLFLDQSDMMTTDYEQKKLYTFQLQDRLQESIETLQGVKRAIVTLGIPEENSYVLKNEKVDVTASVALQLYSNAKLTQKQINGIVSLVTKSVPNLTPDSVAVINEYGEQLNDGSEYGGFDSDSKIETINQLNKILEDRIKDLLAPVFGKGNISIATNVSVDFSHVTSEEISYTPVIGDNGILSWVDQSSQTSGATPGSGTTDGVPTYAENTNAAGDSGISSSSSYEAQYLVNQLVQNIQNNGGNIKDVTVAVIINSDRLSDEEKAIYKELVAYCAGVLVDKVSLTNARFRNDTSAIPVNNDDMQYLLTLNIGGKEIVILSGSVLTLLVLIVAIILAIRQSRKKKLEKKLAEEKAKMAEKKLDAEKMPGEIVLNETREQALKRQIKEFAAANAETVAQLLRVWIKEDESK